MKLHPDTLTSLNTFTGYGDGFVEVNARRYDTGLLMMPEGPVQVWEVANFEALRAEHFDMLASRRPELVILGTGSRQRFPHPRLLRALTDAYIGVESMDSKAACRTYNVLMAEGRQVLVALLLT
jgi:uncharacterized protein